MEQIILNRSSLLQLLDQFQAESQDCITVYLTQDSLRRLAGEIRSRPVVIPEEAREVLEDESILQATGRYESGLVLIQSAGGNGIVVLPPFNIAEDRVSQGAVDTSPLRQLLEQERLIGMVLVNWGSYAVGVFQGNTLVSSKVGSGHIHKRHKKGGSSQKRFARRTEEQKKEFLGRAANRVEQIFHGYQMEHIFFGGNRLILKPLLNESVYMMSHAAQISPRHLHARYNNHESLLSSLEDVYKSLCFRF